MDSAQIESLSRTTVDVAYHCGQLAKNLLALECCRMKAVSRRTRLVYMCISTPPLSLSLLVYALSLSLSLPLSVCVCVACGVSMIIRKRVTIPLMMYSLG